MEEAGDDPEDTLLDPPLLQCLVDVLELMRLSLFHGLFSSSIENILATLQKSIRHEISKRQRQFTLHDVTSG